MMPRIAHILKKLSAICTRVFKGDTWRLPALPPDSRGKSVPVPHPVHPRRYAITPTGIAKLATPPPAWEKPPPFVGTAP